MTKNQSWPASDIVSGHVCLVEGNDVYRERLEKSLSEAGLLEVFSCPTAGAGWQRITRYGADVLIVGTPSGPMNAATLMRRVQEKTPQVVRVVLSDEEPAQVFRRMPYAHQFFKTTVDSQELRVALLECLQLHGLLQRPTLRSLVSSSNRLPATPRLYSQLIEKLGDPRCSMVKVADIIEKDMAMSTRLLQVVSSAFFGLPSEMRSIGACVAYLGTETIRSLVLSEEISRDFPATAHGFSSEGLQAKALSMSRLTRRLASDIVEPGQAFITGLLHGVGQLVLASRAPTEFSAALELSERQGISQGDAEFQILGATNAQVGAYLLALWGLPLSVVRAVAAQDIPQTVDAQQAGMATIAYLGKRLSEDPETPLVNEARPVVGLSEPYLAQVGVLEQLPRWRELAVRLVN